MKYLLRVLVICFCLQGYSQQQIVYFGIDPTLAVVGAYDYDNTPVLHAHFSWITANESGNEGGIYVSYANLQPYNYFDMGFLYNRRIVIFKTDAIDTLLGAEIGLIVRSYPLYDTQKAYLDYGLNAQTRFWFTKNFGVYSKLSFGPRNDLDYYGEHQFAHYDVEIGIQIGF
jgi:hypothetical protein